jgi:hypothetical protein
VCMVCGVFVCMVCVCVCVCVTPDACCSAAISYVALRNVCSVDMLWVGGSADV